jgi:hypothetical protein
VTKLSDAERFLQAIFREHERYAIFANLNPPAHTRNLAGLDGTRDCYWSIAAFPPEAKTNLGDDALHTVALVIDDVGTKVPEGAVMLALGRPTAIVETSRGNHQWVYRLANPVARDDWPGFFGGVEALIGHVLEARGAQTLMRLPMGVNTKPERGGFHVKLAELNPEIELDPDTVARVHDKITKGSREVGGGEWSLAHLRALLALVPNDYERAGWIEIGHGLKALCADDAEGFLAFDEWSATHDSYDAVATRKAWDSFGAGSGLLSQGGRLKGIAESQHPSRYAAIVFDDGEAVPPLGPIEPARAGITATPYKWVDPEKIPPRDWLYGKILIRKFISMTVAPGGVGKSSLIAVETLAQVTGRNLLGEKSAGELRVWLWNLEDPGEETTRKLQAVALHYGIEEADIGGRLFVDSGREQRLVIAVTERNAPTIVRPVIRALVEQIRLRGIDVVVVDPFVSCHEVPENDNTAQDMVVKEWGRVAELGGCAVHLVDHTSKAGSKEVVTDSSRGGKAKTDAARVVRVVNRMSEADGAAYGIINTWGYFNTFNDKANMAPPVDRRDWFRLESVGLGNGSTAASAFKDGVGSGVLMGDDVGVVTRWEPPNATTLVTGDNFKKMVTEMGVEEWRKDYRTQDKWIGVPAARALGLLLHSPRDRKQIKDVLSAWFRAGLLKEVEQLDEHRKLRKFIKITGGF